MLKKIAANKGFTLLEIIIVIIILGVMAGLAMPRFIRTVEYARAMILEFIRCTTSIMNLTQQHR